MSFDLKIKDGDLKISSEGDLQKIENTEKLIQDILKMLSTGLGDNPFYPWYGCAISKSIIGSAYSFSFTASLASSQLKTSLETLQKMQQAQMNAGQIVTAEETLAAVQSATVERNQVDPRYFRVIVKGLTKAFTTVSTSFDIGL